MTLAAKLLAGKGGLPEPLRAPDPATVQAEADRDDDLDDLDGDELGEDDDGAHKDSETAALPAAEGCQPGGRFGGLQFFAPTPLDDYLRSSYICVVTGGHAVRWTWDEKKNRTNRRDHRVSFETAQLVFDNPYHLSLPDPSEDEERGRTIGLIGKVVVFVVHTEPAPDPDTGKEVGRIISARKATSHERNAYEEGKF